MNNNQYIPKHRLSMMVIVAGLAMGLCGGAMAEQPAPPAPAPAQPPPPPPASQPGDDGARAHQQPARPAIDRPWTKKSFFKNQ